MRSVRGFAFAMASSVLAMATGGFAACQMEKVAELPVTMTGLRPTILAKLDGREVRMLADTGSFYSVISPASAAEMRLQIRPAPFALTVQGIGGVMKTSLTTVKDFRLGAIVLRQVEFIVGGSEPGADVDATLGRNLLTGFDSEYDLANGVIRMMKPTGCGAQALAYWRPGDFSSVDMIIGDQTGGHPAVIVPVSVNGKEMKASLDTEAPTP